MKNKDDMPFNIYPDISTDLSTDISTDMSDDNLNIKIDMDDSIFEPSDTSSYLVTKVDKVLNNMFEFPSDISDNNQKPPSNVLDKIKFFEQLNTNSRSPNNAKSELKKSDKIHTNLFLSSLPPPLSSSNDYNDSNYGYSCIRCKLYFTSESLLNQHYQYSHTNKNLLAFDDDNNDDDDDDDDDNDNDDNDDDIESSNTKNKSTSQNDTFEGYSCDRCGTIFMSDNAFNRHACNKNYGSIPTEDIIPTNIYGKYPCPICGKKYSTVNMLGEHFMRGHANYEDFLILDDNIVRLGFPGFELLNIMGMTNDLTDIEIKNVIKMDAICMVCYQPYKFKGNSYKPIDIETLCLLEADKYTICNSYSDSDLYEHYKLESYFDQFNEQEEIYVTTNKMNKFINIRDNTLLEKYNAYMSTERLPITLTCCNASLCHDCLENYITLTDSVICPFCKKDHTRTDIDYITIIEPSDDIDSSKWATWWKKHIDLFY